MRARTFPRRRTRRRAHDSARGDEGDEYVGPGRRSVRCNSSGAGVDVG